METTLVSSVVLGTMEATTERVAWAGWAWEGAGAGGSKLSGGLVVGGTPGVRGRTPGGRGDHSRAWSLGGLISLVVVETMVVAVTTCSGLGEGVGAGKPETIGPTRLNDSRGPWGSRSSSSSLAGGERGPDVG